MRNSSIDVLIVGAGPAGLAAAWTASRSGSRIVVLDDNPHPGGQIWRGEHRGEEPSPARVWLDRLADANIEHRSGMRVVASSAPGSLVAERASGVETFPYRKLILATGARELFLPFPGWTLPGVFGAGGLQAMVKMGLDVRDKRVVLAGTGPLLLAVASYLSSKHAKVVSVYEQTPWASLLGFAMHLVRHPSKLWEAIRLKWSLRNVGFRPGTWPVEVRGEECVESVVLTDGKRRWEQDCDYLACGFGLVANLELPLLLGCEGLGTKGSCRCIDANLAGERLRRRGTSWYRWCGDLARRRTDRGVRSDESAERSTETSRTTPTGSAVRGGVGGSVRPSRGTTTPRPSRDARLPM